MRLRLLALASVAVAAIIGFTAAPAQADHSWNGYHWARSGSTHLTIYSSVTSDWRQNLNTANSDWNKSAYLDNTVVNGSTDRHTRRRCRMPSGAIRVCNYSYGRNGWAGLASISVNGSHITAGYAKMNDTYLAGAGNAERQGVMCQEVGHDFGLDHQDEDFYNPNLGTCMDYTVDWSTNQHPNSHDYDELAAIYGHSDFAAAGESSGSPGKSRIVTGDTITIITWA